MDRLRIELEITIAAEFDEFWENLLHNLIIVIHLIIHIECAIHFVFILHGWLLSSLVSIISSICDYWSDVIRHLRFPWNCLRDLCIHWTVNSSRDSRVHRIKYHFRKCSIRYSRSTYITSNMIHLNCPYNVNKQVDDGGHCN